MISLVRLLLAPVALLAFTSVAAFAAESFSTTAPYAILMDADSQTVLFERNADDLTSPASVVKIMQLKRPGRIRFEYGRGANM